MRDRPTPSRPQPRATGLTTPISVLVLCLVAFAVDLYLITTHHTHWLDQNALDEAVDHRSGTLNTVMKGVTNAAEIPLVLLSVLIALLLARTARSWWPIVLVGATGVLSVLAATVVKNLTDRSRPSSTFWVVHETDYSFPSRHTTMTAALLPVLAYLIAARVRSRSARGWLWAAAVVLTAVIGSSRIYLGVHWTTDVLGGAALGCAVAVVVIGFDMFTRGPRSRPGSHSAHAAGRR